MHILVFGDSIAYGAWDLEGGWIQRLRKFFDERQLKDFYNPNIYCLVYNLGISGDTTKEVLENKLQKASDRRMPSKFKRA